MNMLTGMSESHQLPANFTHTLIHPGLPFTTLLNCVIMLLEAYNVKHNATRDFTAPMSMETGNKNMDDRFMADYLSFKMFLDGLNRDYQEIICQLQGTGTGLYMTFQCR